MKRNHNKIFVRLSRSSRRGLSLIETALAMAVMAVMLVFMIQMLQGDNDRIIAKNTADRLVEVSTAAHDYMSANYANLLTTAPTSGAVVIPAGRTTMGGAVPVGSLQEKGFLPPSFVDANRFQQNTALLVHKVDSTTLEGLVTTYGGRDIPDRILGMIAKYVGPAGGYVPTLYVSASDTGYILGVDGGWRSQASSWGSSSSKPVKGHVATTSAFNDGGIIKDYLYRIDIGNPEANRMYTAIDMNSNAINNISKLSGVVDAVSGGKAVIVGDTTDPNTLRATRDIWADQDVKATRDVSAGRNVTAAADVKAGNNVSATANVTAGGNVTAAGSLNGGSLAVTNDGTVGGNLTVSQKITSNDLQTANLSMDTVIYGSDIGGGTRYTKSQGITLRDLLPRMVPQYSYVTLPGQAIPKPTCAGGYSNARVMIYKQVISATGTLYLPLTSSNGDIFVNSAASWVTVSEGIVATDKGTYWTLDWYGNDPAPGTTRQALTQTFCWYG